MKRTVFGTLTLAGVLALASCLSVQVSQRAPDEDPVKTPKKFVTLEEPRQEPTDFEGLFRVPNIDANLFYYEKDGAWYRFAYNKWFQAFNWDGSWFEMPQRQVPPVLLKVAIDREPEQDVQEQLRKQEEKLREIDKQQRLKQLEERMKRIEEREKQQGGEEEEPSP